MKRKTGEGIVPATSSKRPAHSPQDASQSTQASLGGEPVFVITAGAGGELPKVLMCWIFLHMSDIVMHLHLQDPAVNVNALFHSFFVPCVTCGPGPDCTSSPSHIQRYFSGHDLISRALSSAQPHRSNIITCQIRAKPPTCRLMFHRSAPWPHCQRRQRSRIAHTLASSGALQYTCR